VRCVACGQDNRDDARFCRACGKPMALACAACGAELVADARFCDRCGARAGSEAPTPPPASYTPAHLAARIRASGAALEGERKLVTVLFADVAESTTIAERIDPEEMRTLVDRCFGHMLEEVHRFEGTVNQFTGDGIMALFGAPVALEDAPRRAIQAALAIQRALAGCREELFATCGISLEVRIGIHTGLVVFGRIGNDLRVEYTAIGDTMNLAARIQTLAPPASVAISDATRRLAGPFFELRDLGTQVVKGRSEPVHVWEVAAERPTQDAFDAASARGLTPLAGRDRELAALAEAFAAAEAARGSVVFVVGEAGIGKSRLLHEFRGRLARTPHTWIEGRCSSYGRSAAFLPIGDLLRRALRIEDHDDERTAAGKVDAAADALGRDVGWTKPFVRLLLSLPSGDPAADALDAASRRAETSRALKMLLLRAAEEHPVVVLVEDLHWIDAASEEFLAFLADAVPTARLLLVLTHRPGHRPPFGDRSYHLRITLGALGAPEMAAMAESIVGASPPPEVAALLARKAEGNPLFVEELTKSLLEEGVLERRGDRLVLTRPIGDVAVPDSIHGVLMARLDRLEQAPKQALQLASVIGREFALRLLARVTEVGERVSSLVGELRALELIYEKAAHPELAYMFKHALTHDVAYESILLQRRRELHRTIGRAIEELYADRLAEHYETLAFHFSRGEDWQHALEYHARAAEKALAAYSSDAAIHHCREALAIADRLGASVPPGRRHAVETMLGGASFYTSAYVPAAEAYVRAADAAPGPEERASALVRAGDSFVWGHRYAPAAGCLDEAVRIARRHGLRGVEAFALAEQGFQIAVTTGDIDRVAPIVEDAIRIGSEAGAEEAVATAQLFLAQGCEWRGRFADALALTDLVVATARRRRLAHLVVWAEWFGAKAASATTAARSRRSGTSSISASGSATARGGRGSSTRRAGRSPRSAPSSTRGATTRTPRGSAARSAIRRSSRTPR
jgi:class 3 adenylate cyclase/tetratricopeptide (TPR) repeat protein